MAKSELTTDRKYKVKIKRSSSLIRQQSKAFYAIMGPYVLFMLGVKGFPILWGLYISFTNYTGFNTGNLNFVGLNNYVRVFTDNDAFSSMGRTFYISSIVIPISIFICLMLALLLSTALRGIGVFRTVYYLPSIVPAVAVASMWQGIFMKEGGLLNSFLHLFSDTTINWLGYEHVQKSLMIMLLWGAGSGVLTNLAAIKAIPNELYESADLEGANFFQKTFKITFPMISGMIYMNLITGFIAMLQLFAQPVLLSGTALTSLPLRPIYTYLVHVYQQIFVNLRFGYGLAMVWVIFIIIMTITFITDKTSKYWVHNELE